MKDYDKTGYFLNCKFDSTEEGLIISYRHDEDTADEYLANQFHKIPEKVQAWLLDVFRIYVSL